MPTSPNPSDIVQKYLESKTDYQLGHLITESGHPATVRLSELAQSSLQDGYRALRTVDLEMLKKASENFIEPILDLQRRVADCFQRGGKVFLGGCGATGRLSICLERLWREQNPSQPEFVQAFMAGGDVAFVHAIEGFEDFAEFGSRQLKELGFTSNDLFLGITEGGETNFVIGATRAAAEISDQNAMFLFCNPEELLKSTISRSREILNHPNVQSLELCVGPMALAGSTRMQASTILMFAAGWALQHSRRESSKALRAELIGDLENLSNFWDLVDLETLSQWTEWEASVYQGPRGRTDQTLYVCENWASTIFTDTTERAPTFSLSAFDNQFDPKPTASLTYVSLPKTSSPEAAWRELFLRPPRTLEWEGISEKAKASYLKGFDFSKAAQKNREKLSPEKNICPIRISEEESGVVIRTEALRINLKTSKLGPLGEELCLKMILNAHSTLVMGRVGRYQSHYMTWVSPSNGKLIDRATRYVQSLAKQQCGRVIGYDDCATAVILAGQTIKGNEPVVLRALERLKVEGA